MKKRSKLRGILNKTSFQAQLFIIVLLCFVIFVVAEYLVVQYTFRTKYSNNETEMVLAKSRELASRINSEANDCKVISDFYSSTEYTPIVCTNSGGEFLLKDSIHSGYSICVEYEGEDYILRISDLSISLSVGDIVSVRAKKSTGKEYLECLSIKIGDTEHKLSYYDDNDRYMKDATIKEVRMPDNINYMFENSSMVTEALSLINNKTLQLEEVTMEGCVNAYFFKDISNGKIYFLFRPKSYSLSTTYVLVLASIIDTDSILSMVSGYYGYIILITIVIAILISLFIARAFSFPIKQIETDMRAFAKGNFSQSSHEFKNSEMISLERTLNSVKNDTRKKVENIENQAKSLEALNSEILQQEELRKVFIQRLSHELKTPLMVASATTEALMSGLIPADEQDREYENILNELDKATEIIKDIINTYKSTNKEMRLNKSRFDLTALVNSTIKALLPLSTRNSLEVRENIDNFPIYIDADENLISQVISNFITNAFKYTDEGRLVEIILKDRNTSIIFEVRNYGSKIKEENLEKIWLPFFREQENVDSSSTGMGLFIVKTILQSHGFEYDVRNFDEGVVSFFEIQK